MAAVAAASSAATQHWIETKGAGERIVALFKEHLGGEPTITESGRRKEHRNFSLEGSPVRVQCSGYKGIVVSVGKEAGEAGTFGKVSAFVRDLFRQVDHEQGVHSQVVSLPREPAASMLGLVGQLDWSSVRSRENTFTHGMDYSCWRVPGVESPLPQGFTTDLSGGLLIYDPEAKEFVGVVTGTRGALEIPGGQMDVTKDGGVDGEGNPKLWHHVAATAVREGLLEEAGLSRTDLGLENMDGRDYPSLSLVVIQEFHAAAGMRFVFAANCPGLKEKHPQLHTSDKAEVKHLDWFSADAVKAAWVTSKDWSGNTIQGYNFGDELVGALESVEKGASLTVCASWNTGTILSGAMPEKKMAATES